MPIKLFKPKDKQPQPKLFSYSQGITDKACKEFYKEFSNLPWERQNDFIQLYENFVMVLTHLVYGRAKEVNISSKWRLINEEGIILLQYVESDSTQIFDLKELNTNVGSNPGKFVYQTYVIDMKDNCVILDNVLNNKRDVFTFTDSCDLIQLLTNSIDKVKDNA